MNLPLVLMNLVHTLPPYLPKIHSNIFFLSTSRSSEWSLPYRFSNQNFVYISYFSHAPYMPCPSWTCVMYDENRILFRVWKVKGIEWTTTGEMKDEIEDQIIEALHKQAGNEWTQILKEHWWVIRRNGEGFIIKITNPGGNVNEWWCHEHGVLKLSYIWNTLNFKNSNIRPIAKKRLNLQFPSSISRSLRLVVSIADNFFIVYQVC
jgi:hypothetical protein